jgi:CubicO group peptidase (beta-lactamase class C family)
MNRFDAGRHHRALAGAAPWLRHLAGALLLAVASATTVVAISGCAGNGPHFGGSPASDWPRSGGFSAEALKRIDDYVNTDIAGGVIPGAALVIVRDDRVIHERLWGVRDPATRAPMTMDTIFRIYSMTKPITSVAAMMLVEEGRLGLQDPVSQYIPAFRDVKVGVEKKGADGKLALELEAPKRQMTIQDLLRHTSGLTYGFFGEGLVKNAYRDAGLSGTDVDNREFAERLARLPLMFQPGTTWEYSHATDVLGRVIEVVSGKSLGAFFNERLFDPLGMTRTGFAVTDPQRQPLLAEPNANDRTFGPRTEFFDPRKPTRWESGGGGLMSTASDYLRFLRMIVNGGTLDGRRYLSPMSIQLMAANHIAPAAPPVPGPYYSPGPGFGFGLGFAVRTEPGAAPQLGNVGELNWSGAGGTAFWIDPDERMIVVYMMQAPSQRARYRIALRNMIYGAMTVP